MEADADPPVRHPSKLRTIKLPLWVSLALLLMLLACIAYIPIYKRHAERQQEAAVQEVTSRLQSERTAADARSREAFTRGTEEAYRLFGTALAWSVRSALMRKNLDEIDQYFGELVQHQRVRLAVLADPGGNILVTTDRNFAGAQFGQHFPATLLEQKSVTIEPAEGAMKRLVMPIQGLNERLGTVMLLYEPPAGPSG